METKIHTGRDICDSWEKFCNDMFGQFLGDIFENTKTMETQTHHICILLGLTVTTQWETTFWQHDTRSKYTCQIEQILQNLQKYCV